MRPSYSEKELSAILKEGANLIADCVQGRISFESFLAEYDNFYMRHELDGHESDQAERSLLQKHAAEIAVHEAVWRGVLTKLTANEFGAQSGVPWSGFVDHAEGFARLKRIAQMHSRVLRNSFTEK